MQVLVSLNMCLVVGLAVDYVVHLAEGYYMSHARDRKGRLRHALQRMGSSVFSGACTTLGASAFMLFAQIQFFYQVSFTPPWGLFEHSLLSLSLSLCPPSLSLYPSLSRPLSTPSLYHPPPPAPLSLFTQCAS